MNAGRISVLCAAASLLACQKSAKTPPPPMMMMPMMMPAPDANPHGIALEDVTVDAMGRLYETGLSMTPIVVGNGASIGDLDGDGLPDLVLARIARPDSFSVGPSQILFNTSQPGRISFRADDAFAMLAANIEVYGVALGDYDGDGRLDIFLACQGPDHLLHNEGGGRFADVTERAGVQGIRTDFTAGALWFDANDDGLLDLYVTNYVGNTPRQDLCNDPNTKNRLYLNLGDGTFLDASAEAGVENCGATFTAAAADLDGDGRLEIYLANDTFSQNFQPGGNSLPRDALFVRTGVGDTGVPAYANRAADRKIQDSRSTMGIGIADFDADGAPDIYLSNFGPTQLYLWRPASGTYQEAAAAFGLDPGMRDGELLVSWGALPLDLDHDGALEIILVHGSVALGPQTSGRERYLQMSTYFRQPAPGMPFADITGAVGLPDAFVAMDDTKPHSGRGAYLGDLDRDGRLDVLVGAFNEPFRLYRNTTPDDGNRHFLRLRLIGTVSAPDPVGAVIEASLDDGSKISRQHLAGGCTFGHGDFVEDIGLGARMPREVSVRWPSGLVQRIDALPGFRADAEVVVREPAWLAVSARVARAGDPVPVLTYRPTFGLGTATATIGVVRSDGVAVRVRANADGSFTAELPHPGVVRRTRLSISVGAGEVRTHPVIDYR